MQERYLGDVHDYHKFMFLKKLSLNFDCMVGCNWYLVNPNEIGESEIKKNDGEKRNYLSKKLSGYDQNIINEFLLLKKTKNRVLKSFIKKTHLKKYIKFYNDHIDYKHRRRWFENSLYKMNQCKYVFLDPDNGLLPENSKLSEKRKMKYIFPNELKQIYNKNKNVIFCQFQSFNIHHRDMLKIKKKIIKEETGLTVNKSVIRNRVSPNTFFISIVQKENEECFNKFLHLFSKNLENVEIIDI